MVRDGSTLMVDVEVALKGQSKAVVVLPLQGISEVHLCMRRIDRVDVGDMARIVRLFGCLRQRGRRLRFVHVSEPLRAQLTSLGLLSVIPVRRQGPVSEPAPVGAR